MKIKYTLPKLMAILFFIIALASCEEDFVTLNTVIIGNQDLNTEFNDDKTVVAYSTKFTPVQTNGLPVYQLGVYNDPVYGKSSVNLLSQITLDAGGPSFGDNPEVESVILYIPYFSQATVDGDETTYTLDSIFGGSNPMKLSIYESKYFLRDLDPDTNFEEIQKYYSNLDEVFDGGSNLGELLLTIEDFIPSDAGFVLNAGEDDEELIAPGLRVELPIEFFKERILDMEGTPELSNNNNFRDYFRGLYFKIDPDSNGNNRFFFNIASANIVLNYTFDDPVDETLRKDGTFNFSFKGVNVNTHTNELLSPEIEDALMNPNTTQGEETLYLRGGQGIATVINLFGDDTDGNEVADELDDLRNNEWLINEANLIFYVDQDKVTGGTTEPERLIMYDLDNNIVLADYFLDGTANEVAVDAITEHLGRLDRGSDDNGDFYKIRITNHLSNLVNKDSTNVPLGLVVTQNTLAGGFQKLETEDGVVEEVPSACVISPEGTVLYGNNAANQNKKLKLQIFYTKPN